MPKTLNEIIVALPASEQAQIAARAAELIKNERNLRAAISKRRRSSLKSQRYT